jgi:hypothetical protein
MKMAVFWDASSYNLVAADADDGGTKLLPIVRVTTSHKTAVFTLIYIIPMRCKTRRSCTQELLKQIKLPTYYYYHLSSQVFFLPWYFSP